MLSLKSCAESRLPADKIPPDDIDRKCRQVLLYKLAWIYYNGVGIQVPAQCAGTLAIYRQKKGTMICDHALWAGGDGGQL